MGITEVIIISFFAGIATLAGGAAGFMLPLDKRGCFGVVVGFGVGVMIGLSLFSLMPQAYYLTGSAFVVACGFSLGILFMFIFSRLSGLKLNVVNREEESFRPLGLLMALGIALHNFPEGIALGAGFQGQTYLGFVVAFGLFLHNFPEGMSISAPLKKGSYSKGKILLITALAGAVTPLGAWVGWSVTEGSLLMLSLGMGFAAGAMVYIAFAQVIKISAELMDLGIFLGILLTFFLT
ncbi:MAG: ZIP family metal transporter [Bacillota bacterium]|nr:ZIP family metal transporter [Bacillota bacterium]